MNVRLGHPLALAALIALAAGGLAAAQTDEETTLPFSMPVPDGWRTETLPFPLEFAPDLPYHGLEELRFAPGMFEQGADDFWSYAFVWWVDPGDPTDLESIATHLESYFRGLMEAVAEGRGVEIDSARYEAEVHDAGDGGFTGTAHTFDAFVTRAQIVLNLSGDVRDCPAGGARVVFFALSPQDPSHPIWKTLESIRRDFNCDAPATTPAEPEDR